MVVQATQGLRGKGENSYALWEEIRHLKIDEEQPAFIYKRLDLQKHLPIEDRNYYTYIPVPQVRKGIRKSLRTS